jgi:hypothetical protein
MPTRSGRAKVPTKTNGKFLRSLKCKVHFFSADADSAIQLVGRKAKMGILESAKPLFPKLRLVSWDQAHGSRRITQRPWGRDAFLANVVHTLVFSKSSIVSIVHNSPEFRSWFAQSKAMQGSDVAQDVVNFSLARHRFDSTSAPQCLSCLVVCNFNQCLNLERKT